MEIEAPLFASPFFSTPTFTSLLLCADGEQLTGSLKAIFFYVPLAGEKIKVGERVTRELRAIHSSEGLAIFHDRIALEKLTEIKTPGVKYVHANYSNRAVIYLLKEDWSTAERIVETHLSSTTGGLHSDKARFFYISPAGVKTEVGNAAITLAILPSYTGYSSFPKIWLEQLTEIETGPCRSLTAVFQAGWTVAIFLLPIKHANPAVRIVQTQLSAANGGGLGLHCLIPFN